MEQRTKLASQRNSLDWTIPGQSMSRGVAAKVYPKQRYSPYYGKNPSSTVTQQHSLAGKNFVDAQYCNLNSTTESETKSQTVTLQISNLDSSCTETVLWNYLISMLKPITPVISLKFDSHSCAKVTVPSDHFAKSVIAHLHRKKVGHKRILVSYNRDVSSHEYSTLCCQVGCLLKDIPNHSLPLYKFRELFQSRFKITINQLELYKMKDLCTISFNETGDKCITLNSNYVHKLTENPLMNTTLQHSVPYCRIHFQQEQFKGWAEMEIEPLPNVMLTLNQMRIILQSLLKTHQGDIPIASLLYCIRCSLDFPIFPNDNGVNFEHLICCIPGTKICSNVFGIRILSWEESSDYPILDNAPPSSTDPLHQISKEVIELLKVTPKATLQFNKFIPAYHNHFGKQCRVADYGYTRLIDLFEALSSVVQVMGEGENRLITLTHRSQVRRFTADLYKILRGQVNKSLLLSQMPEIFTQAQNRMFDITDYGVCCITDILDGLRSNNTVVIQNTSESGDMLISIPKRKQNAGEIENTCVFAGEVVELCRNASQYSILFQKFVRYYHYHFGFQCRLSDYGFLKLADLLEAITGVIELEFTSYEQKRIFLAPKVAQRIFVEQIYQIILSCTGSTSSPVNVQTLLRYHKDKFGYQILPQSLGFATMEEAIQSLPCVEVIHKQGFLWILCHYNNATFNTMCYMGCSIFIEALTDRMLLTDFKQLLQGKNYPITDSQIFAMSHIFEVTVVNGLKMISMSSMIKFIFSIMDVLGKTFYLSIVELKAMMNLNITSCFPFGYPNLSTLLTAYPDIFILSPSTNVCDRCTVKLNENFVLLKYNISEFLQSLRSNAQTLSQNEMFAKKQLSSIPPPPGLGFSSNHNRSLNFSGISAHGHFSATPHQHPNQESQSSQLKLYERRNGPEALMPGLNSLSHLASLFYEPPKPDTPSSNGRMPYWVDPVWRYQTSPPIECLNIQLPELSTVNLFPIVLSPFPYHDPFQVPADQQGNSHQVANQKFQMEDKFNN